MKMKKLTAWITAGLMLTAICGCSTRAEASSPVITAGQGSVAETSAAGTAATETAATETAATETAATETEATETEATETAATETEVTETEAASPQELTDSSQSRRIQVKDGNGTVILYELNDSTAAVELCAQLPITLEVENFSNNEKVFYPEKKLSTADTPMASGGRGKLAYYAPWGDVVMFYGAFSANGSLYELGEAVEGGDQIENLTGMIEITVVTQDGQSF